MPLSILAELIFYIIRFFTHTFSYESEDGKTDAENGSAMLPELPSTSPELNHLGKSRPKRLKAHATSKGRVVLRLNENSSFSSGML